LWSPRSVVSRWVRAEATLADRNRVLVPARIEPCDLPIMFELTQTAELSHWQGAASGRDARAMTERGLEVIAVEPSAGLRSIAEANSARVRWIDDRLPRLAVL